EHGRQAHPLDQLEQAVLLPVPEGPLRAGQHGVVVGQDRAGAPVAEQLSVDPGGAAYEAVRGRALDQLTKLAPCALRGDRERAVLDEAPGIDEVGDVLAGSPPARRMAALDGF